MTPAAITPAARSQSKRGKGAPGGTVRANGTTVTPTRGRIVTPSTAAQTPGHPRRLRPRPTPKVPRRVSGPAGSRAGASGATLAPPFDGPVEAPARGPAPRVAPRPGRAGQRSETKPRKPSTPRPRRSNPSQRPGRFGIGGLLPRGIARPRRAPAAPPQPVARRTIAFVRAVPDHPWLDRAVRGRVWIAVLGVMLAGIVAMQVEVLKLGASIGRSLQRSTALQGRNEQLRASVAGLADDQRIERLAATMGMVMPTPTGVGFLSTSANSVNRALANIHTPNAQSFAAALAASGVVDTTAATNTYAPTSSTSVAPTATTSPSSSPTSSTSSTGTVSPSPSSSATPSTGSASAGTTALATSQPTPTDTSGAATGTPAPSSTSSSTPVTPTGTVGGAAAGVATQSPASASTGGAGVPAG